MLKNMARRIGPKMDETSLSPTRANNTTTISQYYSNIWEFLYRQTSNL